MEQIIPQRSPERNFFQESAGRIDKYLQATYQPEEVELARWICTPEEIDAQLQNTPYAVLLSPHAMVQRITIFVRLAELGRSLNQPEQAL